MVRGTLDILWANHEQPTATPRYVVHFEVKEGSQRGREFVGSDSLREYLISLGFLPAKMEKTIKEIRESKDKSVLFPFEMSDEEASKYKVKKPVK